MAKVGSEFSLATEYKKRTGQQASPFRIRVDSGVSGETGEAEGDAGGYRHSGLAWSQAPALSRDH